MRYTYFDFPTQVRFYDVDGDKWIGGIAYKDKNYLRMLRRSFFYRRNLWARAGNS